MKGKAATIPSTTFTVQVPLTFHRRGGRKLVIATEGHGYPFSPCLRIDSSMVKAIARAHRWKRMLETGVFATTLDLARAEKINPSYLSRVLRLTLLAPDIVEAILDGRQPISLQLDQLLRPFPVEWDRQRQGFKLLV